MDETKEQAVVNRGQEHPLGRQTIRRDSLEHRLVAADTSGYRSGWGYIRVSGKTGATTRCNIKGHIQNGTVCFVLFARNMHTVYFANVKQGGYFKFTAGRKFYGTFCSRAHNEKEEEHEKRIFRRMKRTNLTPSCQTLLPPDGYREGYRRLYPSLPLKKLFENFTSSLYK